MIRSDILQVGNGVQNYSAFLTAYPTLAQETVTDTFNQQIKPGLLSELRYYPGPVKYPFQFATERSRRWYFANRRDQIPYRRTGNLAARWKVNITQSDDAVAMSVENSAKYLKWVEGNRQVPGHKTTGWQKFAPTVEFWKQAAAEVIMKALNRLINQR